MSNNEHTIKAFIEVLQEVLNFKGNYAYYATAMVEALKAKDILVLSPLDMGPMTLGEPLSPGTIDVGYRHKLARVVMSHLLSEELTMREIISSPDNRDRVFENIAKWSYALADAMEEASKAKAAS